MDSRGGTHMASVEATICKESASAARQAPDVGVKIDGRKRHIYALPHERKDRSPKQGQARSSAVTINHHQLSCLVSGYFRKLPSRSDNAFGRSRAAQKCEN
ncbi:hypothetical protein E4U43_001998, partial [Claviceps pusilla]